MTPYKATELTQNEISNFIYLKKKTFNLFDSMIFSYLGELILEFQLDNNWVFDILHTIDSKRSHSLDSCWKFYLTWFLASVSSASKTLIEATSLQCSAVEECVKLYRKREQRREGNGILFPKLFWPTGRKKNCSSDRGKLLEFFEAEGREFSKLLRSLRTI